VKCLSWVRPLTQDATGSRKVGREWSVNVQMLVEPSNDASPGTRRSESIEVLFAAMESPLLSYAQRLLQDLESAEDVVQEAFLQLHAQFDRVHEPRRWLYRTVHNRALNLRRRADRVVPLEAAPDEPTRTEPADPQPLPDEQIARLEGVGLVRLSLERIDPRSRELVQLKFRDGLSYRQISERTGLTVGNVGYILHHALKALAQDLTKAGIIP
jgi:RNA polymerase sigma factor (sigma-70 family)